MWSIARGKEMGLKSTRHQFYVIRQPGKLVDSVAMTAYIAIDVLHLTEKAQMGRRRNQAKIT